MFELNTRHIKNPISDLLIYFYKHDQSKFENDKLVILIDNLFSNFKKSLSSISLVHNLQKNNEFLKKTEDKNFIFIQNIEYFHYKISTIWDISYEIADILIFPRKKRSNKPKKSDVFTKYDYLSENFENYNKDLSNLKLAWYEDFNKIRNRIVHGGINIKVFLIDDKNSKSRVCFQAYDIDSNDLIPNSYYYSNVHNNYINYADNYFCFYIHLIYSYLLDFFKFVVMEIKKNKDIDIENDLLQQDDVFFRPHTEEYKTWAIPNTDVFKEITDSMILLDYGEGYANRWSNFEREKNEPIFKKYYAAFPFSMMKYIS